MMWDHLPTPAPVEGGSAASEEARTASFTSFARSGSLRIFILHCSMPECFINFMLRLLKDTDLFTTFQFIQCPNCVGHYHSATTVGYGRRNNCGTFLIRYIVILACISGAFSTRCASLAITLYIYVTRRPPTCANLLLYASYSHMLYACTVCVQVTAHSGFSAWA